MLPLAREAALQGQSRAQAQRTRQVSVLRGRQKVRGEPALPAEQTQEILTLEQKKNRQTHGQLL